MKIDVHKKVSIKVNAEDDKPLIFVVSRRTTNWDEIGTISKNDKNKTAIRQYQAYPMLGLEESFLSGSLRSTAEAISLIFSKINLNEFKKIIFVIHDQELFGKAGKYPSFDVTQRLEVEMLSTSLQKCPDDPNKINYNESNRQRFDYFMCAVFKDCTINSECEIELWSFMHGDCDIDKKALTSKKNVYDELIKVLIPNFKKKLVDIKFRTLQLLLPLHIDFIGLSACDETKRNEYWDTIKKVSFSNDQYNETLNEVCTLINGNGSDNVESISSFVADAGFENNKHWVGLKSLIGKDSNADGFFKSFSEDNLSEVVNAIENFKFSSDENGYIREITGWADWQASVVEHFDALIAAC